jgi:hypothetical protein
MKNELTIEAALEILKISGTPSPEELKKAYYAEVKRVHPDIGGTEDETKLVNAAFELLSKANLKKRFDFRAFDLRAAEISESIVTQLRLAFNEDHFLAYLKEIFARDFSYSLDIKVSSIGTTPRPLLRAKFFSQDNETVVHIRGSVDVIEIMNGSSGLSSTGNGDIADYPLSIDINIIHDNKKVKPYRRDYLFTRNSSHLIDPEVLLPRDRMARAIKSSEARRFSKKDMIGSLVSVLGATVDDNFVFIPVGDAHRVAFYRIVFNREAVWGCNGLYEIKPHRRILQGVMSLPETEDTFLAMQEAVVRMRNAEPSEVLEVATSELKKLSDHTADSK